jgi:hypothetical protein
MQIRSVLKIQLNSLSFTIVEQKSGFIKCDMAHDHKITYLMGDESAFNLVLCSRR